jgi:hypothetical protein
MHGCMAPSNHAVMQSCNHAIMQSCSHAVMQFPKHSFRHSGEADQLQKFLLKEIIRLVPLFSVDNSDRENYN